MRRRGDCGSTPESASYDKLPGVNRPKVLRCPIAEVSLSALHGSGGWTWASAPASAKFPADLDHAEVSYASRNGQIKVSWRRAGDGTVALRLQVPAGSRALLRPPLPCSIAKKIPATLPFIEGWKAAGRMPAMPVFVTCC